MTEVPGTAPGLAMSPPVEKFVTMIVVLGPRTVWTPGIGRIYENP